MFDCGIHPALSGQNALPAFDEVDVEKIDLLLVTHFHLDHSGALPYFLTKTVFKGITFMTHPTQKILKLLFSDYVKVSNIGAESERLYSPQDLNLALEKVELIDYHQEKEVNGINFWCYNAGHVLGAAMFMIEIAGIKVLYTGDYSCEEDRHLYPAKAPDVPVDILIVESTYGVQIHEPRLVRERLFTQYVHNIVKNGGKCLLPVFALGRAQELLLILDEYWEAHAEIRDIRIYYASSLAKKCMTVFQTYINTMGESVRRQFEQGRNPFEFKYISNLKSMENFDQSTASVVMASPGMLQNGQSRDLFEQWCEDNRNGLVLTGYCVENTLAKDLLNQPREIIATNGSIKPVNMSVHYVSFSAHADYKQTSNFIQTLKPSYVVLVHGDSNEMSRLRAALERNFTMNVVTPVNCQTVEYFFPVKINAKIVKNQDFPEEGIIVRKEPEHMILPVDSLPDYTSIGMNKFLQKLLVPYFNTFRVLMYLIKSLFPNVLVGESQGIHFFWVEEIVSVKMMEQKVMLEWQAGPLADMVADTIALMVMQVTSNPNPALLQSINEVEEDCRKYSFFVALLEKRFPSVTSDDGTRRIKVVKNEFEVFIDWDNQQVKSSSEILESCVKDILSNILKI
jgi:cleavage and polyadenylation specificity factor subunit 3